MVIIIMGVAGSGKTSVGKALSALTGWLFLDADDYHSDANIAKMARGEPLGDADRAPWLARLQAVITEKIDRGEDTILACSALKQAYRSQLRSPDPQSGWFVYLKVPPELLQERLKQRSNHFMQLKMLDSQLKTLEEPQPDAATIVPVRSNVSPQMLAADIQRQLQDRGFNLSRSIS
jgi:gluconokinase